MTGDGCQQFLPLEGAKPQTILGLTYVKIPVNMPGLRIDLDTGDQLMLLWKLPGETFRHKAAWVLRSEMSRLLFPETHDPW